MIKSKFTMQNQAPEPENKKRRGKKQKRDAHYKEILKIGEASTDLINELGSPIDSINRFINLALQTVGEDSQGRQFLLESKRGIRETTRLINQLDQSTKRLDEALRELSRCYEETDTPNK